MEDVVAVALRLPSGRRRYVLTWGRVLAAKELETAVLKAAPRFDLGGRAVVARLCNSLRSAAGQPYFHEALFMMAQTRIPFGRGYSVWRRRMARRIRMGRELWYLGR